MTIQNIAIIGVGGVGGYVGGLMTYHFTRQPQSTRRVHFIARGAHLRQIHTHGLILNTSEQQGLICQPASAVEDLRDLPTPDMYLVCVKSYDLEQVARQISQNMTDQTIVLPLLNGVDIYDRLRDIIHTGIVLPACAYVATHIEQPGTVTQKGKPGQIFCGPDPIHLDVDSQDIIACFQEAHLNFTWQPDPYSAIWEKYIFIAAFGLVTASSGKSLGEVMADAALTQQVRGIMAEIVAIATCKGVALPETILETAVAKASNFPFEARTSYQRDVETPGKKNEGDLFGGTILRFGQQLGIPTPVTQEHFTALQQRRT